MSSVRRIQRDAARQRRREMERRQRIIWILVGLGVTFGCTGLVLVLAVIAGAVK